MISTYRRDVFTFGPSLIVLIHLNELLFMFLLNVHDLAFSELLNFSHMVIMALFPDPLNNSSIRKVYLPMSIKLIILDSSNIELVALFPFTVSILGVCFSELVASDNPVVGLELAVHSFTVVEFSFELDAIIVDKLAFAVGFAVVKLPNIQ